MKEEDRIKKTLGTENPFRVPDGFFDQLASEVMQKLPEKEPVIIHEPTKWEKIRPLIYMAAMFIGAALIIRVASSHYTPSAGDEPTAIAAAAETVEDEEKEMEYIDLAMENAMMDDYSLYVYLADAETE